LDKISVVEKFQKARLYQWIGDYDEAQKLYEQIEQNEEEMAYILKPTVKQKKKELPLNKDMIDFKPNEDITFKYVAAERVTQKKPLYLFDVDKLKPENKRNIKSSDNQTKWQYSISIISRADDELRLEIRGFNPLGEIPNMKSKIEISFSVLDVESVGQTEGDIIWYNGKLTDSSNLLYISVDCWGLLCGTALVREDNLGDTLSYIHITICELDKAIWKY
jgi:hypothetical protein